MVDTFSNIAVNTLPEKSFIGGSYKELSFTVTDVSGSPVDISSFTYSWILSPYGTPETSSISKSGVFDITEPLKNKFKVYLYSYDTINLSGKYIQQPILVGAPGYEFRLGQGYITIIPAAGLNTVQDTATLEEQMISFVQVVSASSVAMQAQINVLSASVVNNYAATSASFVSDRLQLTALSASAVNASGSLTIISASVASMMTGWIPDTGTWTYISASAVAVPSDATSRFSVGDKVKFTLDANVRYYYIIGIPTSTVLYLYGGSDYTISSSPITLPSYSKMQTPSGFPQWFNFTTGIYGVTGALTSACCVGRLKMDGKQINVKESLVIATNGTGATGLSTNLPVNAKESFRDNFYGTTLVYSTGVWKNFVAGYLSSASVITIYKNDGTYPVTTGSIVILNGSYEV